MKPQHIAESLQEEFANAWQAAVAYGKRDHGSHGALISGVYRDHWPKPLKGYLRALCRERSRLEDLAARLANPRRADYGISSHGSLYLIEGSTPEASENLAGNVSEDSQWFGNALAVEPRYVETLAGQLLDEGWTVNLDGQPLTLDA